MDKHSSSVLIFEDDIDLRRQWTEALKRKGLQVEHTFDLDAAIEFCRHIQFDVIICDLFIKNTSGEFIPKAGVSLISYLRNNTLKQLPDWTAEVPIIVVTGAQVVNQFDSLKAGLVSGGTIGLRKPFTNQKLVDTVCEFLNNK